MGVLKKQVQNLNLSVNVAWIGNHLPGFVESRTEEKKATLFFNWWPNTLITKNNYTRIKFPLCNKHQTEPIDCDFEINQLNKLVWSKLASNAPEAYHVISKMEFTLEQYEDLLRYMSVTETQPDHNEVACRWVRNNKDVWSHWIPPNLTNKTKIYLGGMFPLSGALWKMPGIVPGRQNLRSP